MTPAVTVVINRVALKHNLKKVREVVPQAKVMAVIKANGYGHGLIRVATAMAGANALAVARIDEAVFLRKNGFKQRIVVLEGFTCLQELTLLGSLDLEPVVHSPDQVALLESADSSKPLSIWLKIDTGMHRLGIDADQFFRVLERLEWCSMVRQPIPLMTHLSCADEQNSPETLRQLDQFIMVTAGVVGERSIANSAGVLAWPQTHSDWVRPGIMLYGVSPFGNGCGADFGLRPVMTLRSRLIAIKTVKAGESVGYGAAWRSRKTILLGVVSVGYGDGYPRAATNGTPVLVNGKRAALVGRVSMDMITVDLSHQRKAKVGDPVVLWGDGLPVEEIARSAMTIPYTLLCGITQRVRVAEKTE